jgi:hypothetical protein
MWFSTANQNASLSVVDAFFSTRTFKPLCKLPHKGYIDREFYFTATTILAKMEKSVLKYLHEIS